MRTIVFDIETVPDYTVWFDFEKPKVEAPAAVNAPAPNPLAVPEKKKPGRKPKAASGTEPFPPLHAHAVICIGYCVIDDGVPIAIDAIAGTRETESALLVGFGDFVKNADARIVTWNGRTFDIPVLKQRSLHHGVPQPLSESFARYSADRHLDLCDVISEYGARGITGYNLDTFARLIGLPGKNGADGTQVRTLYDARKFDDIRGYCRRDVVQTTYVYLRHRLMKTQITREQYREACAALRKLWQGDDYFSDFKVDKARLELAE
jgi:3'-5' exonuclease